MTAMKKISTLLLLALAAGTTACTAADTGANLTESDRNVSGARSAEVFANACVVTTEQADGSPYSMKIFDFNYGTMAAKRYNREYGMTVSFNQMTTTAAQREVMAMYRQLPHEANCPAPRFAPVPAPAAA